MTTIDRSQLIESILKQRRTTQAPPTAVRNVPAVITPEAQQADSIIDQTEVRSGQNVLEGLAAAQPKLLNESLDTLERGFRRTQLYRQSDGRDFIRNEEIILTERGLKRTVQQQNPSGSAVTFEENLDRQADGTFRRTVRYIDETGAAQTKIDAAPAGINSFIMSGGIQRAAADPFAPTRGQYYDLSV